MALVLAGGPVQATLVGTYATRGDTAIAADQYGNLATYLGRGIDGLNHWITTVKGASYPSTTTLNLVASQTSQTVTFGAVNLAGPALPDVRAAIIDLYNNPSPARTITAATLQFQDTGLGVTNTVSYPYPISLSLGATSTARLIFPTPRGIATTPLLQFSYNAAPNGGTVVAQLQLINETLDRMPSDYLAQAPFATIATTPGTSLLAAPSAPAGGALKYWITGVVISNSGTADGVFSLTNGSGGSTLFEVSVPHGGSPVSFSFDGDNEIPLSTNTALYGVSSSSSATMVGTAYCRVGVQ